MPKYKFTGTLKREVRYDVWEATVEAETEDEALLALLGEDLSNFREIEAVFSWEDGPHIKETTDEV